MAKPTPLCSKCGHHLDGLCLLLRTKITEDSFCPEYTESPYTCEMCGNHIPTTKVMYEAGIKTPWHLLCTECSQKLSSCVACKHSQICSFQQDTSIKEQPYIAKTMQHGVAIMQTQVKNPQRIQLTCTKCPCYINEACLKEENSRCEKFQNYVTGW